METHHIANERIEICVCNYLRNFIIVEFHNLIFYSVSNCKIFELHISIKIITNKCKD